MTFLTRDFFTYILNNKNNVKLGMITNNRHILIFNEECIILYNKVLGVEFSTIKQNLTFHTSLDNSVQEFRGFFKTHIYVNLSKSVLQSQRS